MRITSFQSLAGRTWVLSEEYCVLGYFKSEAEAEAHRKAIVEERKAKPQGVVLVAMRLADMTRMHPRQDDSRSCLKCGERVGIYPSGQAALQRYPGAIVMCVQCAKAEPAGENEPAGSWEDIRQESRDSFDVGKA